MSSPEDGNDSEPLTASKSKNGDKKKRVRACDMCRRRKGDGDRMPNGLCTNCKTYDYKCTYAPKKRAVDPEYIQSLETQLAQAQEALRKLSARLDVMDNADQPPSRRSSPASSSSAFLPARTPQSPTLSTNRFPSLTTMDQADVDPSDDEISTENSVQYGVQSLLHKYGHKQFVGKSSSILLLQQAMNMKEAAHNIGNPGTSFVPSTDTLSSMCAESFKDNPWVSPPEETNYKFADFPDPELLRSLVELYFSNSNLYIPLLNRIIFQRDLDSGLHLRDEGFGSTVLLVCAVGSRYSVDKRVLLDGLKTESWHAAGWRWFRRVQKVRKVLDLRPPTIYDLQIPALAAVYLYGSPTPHSASVIVAYGLRMSMDLGAHKRKAYKTVANVEDELLKRAFWVMVVLDRTLSGVLGRPCCVQDEDYDLEFPIECDDEYWFKEEPELAFKQPPGKPSLITAFNYQIRLSQIQACTLRTIYATNKSKAVWGLNDDWQPEVVALLDSSLNKWIDSLPPHLKWEPNMPNEQYMHQSAMLYSCYYHLQVTVHRSFIPIPSKPASNGHMSLPSLTICTNAARSCIHILEAQFKRSVLGGYQNLIALFNSGIVLVLNIWATKHAGISSKSTRDLEDVFKVICMLKALESRMYIASRVVECLKEIAAIGNVPFPGEAAPPRRGTKRTRDGDDIYETNPISAAASNVSVAGLEPRAMAGSQRVHHHASRAVNSSPSSSSSVSSVPPSYMQSSGIDQTPSSLYQEPWMSPDSTWSTPYTISTPSAMPSVPTNGFTVHDASTSYALPPTDQHPCNCLPQQPPVYQESQFTAAGTSTMPPMDYAQPPTTVNHMPPESSHQQAWNTPTPPSAQPQMDDPMAASYSPQFFDSDILAMLSSAPTSIEWTDWGAYINNLSDVDNVRDLSAGVSHL